jgi:hypothetical protein
MAAKRIELTAVMQAGDWKIDRDSQPLHGSSGRAAQRCCETCHPAEP